MVFTRWMSEREKTLHPFGGLEITIIGGVIGFILLALICAPNFVLSGSSPGNACINNLRIIDAAKQEWALEHNVKATNAWVAETDIMPYIGLRHEFPRCPSGGIYSIGRLNEVPTCSIGGLHVLKVE